jgi:hypothetical protein
VTGSPDWDAIARMIDLVLDACGPQARAQPGPGQDQPGGTAGTGTAATGTGGPGAGRPALPPEAREAPQYAMARLAIDFVSVNRRGCWGWDEDQSWTLARMGWSPQVPARRAAERDEAAIAAWRQETWPVIKGRPSSRAPGWSSRTSPGRG